MKLAGIAYNAKNEIPLFYFLKLIEMKILLFKDLLDFFNSAHFLLLYDDQIFTRQPTI